MKRFLSMLAMAVLVLQSVVTSLVYAAEPEQTNSEESVSEAVVETTTDEVDADESSITTDLVDTEIPVVEEPTADVVDPEAPTIEEQVIIEPEVPVVGEPKVIDAEDEEWEDAEEFDFEPLKLWLNLTPRLFAVGEPEQSNFAQFIEKWNNAESCENTENQAWCVDNPQQSSVEIAPGEDINAWEVWMWKLVQPTDNPWEYEISIAVKGQPVEEEVYKDVCSVVVFDKSYSMWDECSYNCDTRYNYQWYNYWDKWNNAMNWAISFSNNLISQVPDSKIWLVTFAKTATISVQLQTWTLVEWDFGSLDASTNIHAWLIKAKDVLENCSDDAKKYIVLISDWEPNYAVNVNGSPYQCKSNCWKKTKEYADELKSGGIIIYSIWYETNSTADEILMWISNGDGYFYTWDTSSITEAFKEIVDSVTKDAWTDAHVVDNLWENITISYGDNEYGFDKITAQWHVHTFTVRIDPTKEWNQETNAWATLTYKDVDENPASQAISTSASVNRVLPKCGWEKPATVDGISFWNEKFTQTWGGDGKLTPGTKDWEYKSLENGETLWACEWTCDGEWYEYDAENNTCKLENHTVVVDPNCAEWEDCEDIEEDVNHGSKYTLPTLERKYILTYQEDGRVQDKVNPNPVTVEAILLGYCKDTEECTDIDMKHAWDEVEVTDDVTYYAVWNETPLTVTLEDWNWYTTPEYNYNFKEWQNEWKTVSESITLIKDETLVAKYDAEPREYTVTYKVDWETYGDVDTVMYGTELTPRDKPSKTWYTFSGWSEIPTTMPAENLVIEWSFIPNTYTVKFDANGGEWEMEDQSFTYDEQQALTTNTFTKDWYKFNWWKAWEDSYSDWQVVSNLTSENWATITLKAEWIANSDTVYTVEYYFQNVEGNDYVLDEDKTENKSWTTDTEASVTPEEIPGFTLNTENSTLTWIISADGELVLQVYYDRTESSITIDPNCEDENEVCDITTETWSYEKEVTLPEKIRSYTLSYKVPEWALEVDFQTVTATVIWYCKGNSADCDESERIPVWTPVKIEAESVTYTAVWSDDMTVTVADGNDYQTESTVYTFNTWKDGDKDVAPQSRLTLTADKELIANYTENARNYMITFVNEDGTVLQSGDVAYGEMPKYTGETPTKEGNIEYAYIFDNWTPELTWVTESAVYTATYIESCNTGYHYETSPNGTTADKICVNDEKKEWVVCTQEWAPSNAHYNVTTWAWTWNGTTYVWVKCEWACNQWYIREGNSCKPNWWWGGGWGWWGSTKYYDCNTGSLPANASANNTTTRESSKIDYSYGTDSWCTFQCKLGYTWNGQECTKWGGWWNNDEEIELGWQVSDKCSIEWFEWSEEEKAAYLYACENDITTIRDINEARLKDFLTRAEMAKMVSVFATKELWMKPNTSKDCSNFANSISHYNQEMKDYMVMSCQLELMWIHTVDYKAIPDFMPSKRVSRAEFGTVLSRVLWWNKYEWTNSNYYINHLNALKENNIITNINPNITEYRAWVFLMLYRAVEAIKVFKSTNGVAIDQQVNEELQEEWKAETWLVVEYDSGSVVPDMATVTESWTLTTGSVAEAGAWSTVESKTGDTVTTTWDIAKDEAKVETESTTWSAN